METGNQVMRLDRWRHVADCIIEWKNIPHRRSNYLVFSDSILIRKRLRRNVRYINVIYRYILLALLTKLIIYYNYRF